MALVASLLVSAPVLGTAKESAVSERTVSGRTGGHLSLRSSLRDLLNHPAFRGFGQLLLPWDDRAYDR
jgi:hypothetical protein